MTARLPGRRILVSSFTGLLGLSMAVAGPPGQDPWGKVPALPTGCFSNDGFYDRMRDAMDSMAADIERQTEINAVVSENYRNLDPAEMQSRMMEFLTQHPQEAMEFMQKVQAMGQQPTSELYQKIEEHRQSLVAEYETLQSRFDAALEPSWAPARNMMAALGDGCGASPPGPKELAAIDRVNAEYRRLCGEYWNAGGHFEAWLKRYREYLVKEKVPAYEAADKQQLEVWAVMKIPSDTFKSTAAMTAVRDYMQEVQKVYQERWQAPWPPR